MGMIGEQQLPSLITQQLYCCFPAVVTLLECARARTRAGVREMQM